MPAWVPWLVLALTAIGWGVTWSALRRQAREAALRAVQRAADLSAGLDTASHALQSVAAQYADLKRDHFLALQDWSDETARLRTDLALVQARLLVSEDRVSRLSELHELAKTVEQARVEWQQAYETSARTVGAFDALLQQHYAQLDRPAKTPVEGWRIVLLDAGGATVSVRRIRDDHVPLRISRGHGATVSWHRLTRLEGLTLVYTPEDPL